MAVPKWINRRIGCYFRALPNRDCTKYPLTPGTMQKPIRQQMINWLGMVPWIIARHMPDLYTIINLSQWWCKQTPLPLPSSQRQSILMTLSLSSSQRLCILTFSLPQSQRLCFMTALSLPPSQSVFSRHYPYTEIMYSYDIIPTSYAKIIYSDDVITISHTKIMFPDDVITTFHPKVMFSWRRYDLLL